MHNGKMDLKAGRLLKRLSPYFKSGWWPRPSQEQKRWAALARDSRFILEIKQTGLG